MHQIALRNILGGVKEVYTESVAHEKAFSKLSNARVGQAGEAASSG
jgi:hypothetical protein